MEIRGTVALFAPAVSPNARAILLYLWTYARPMEEPAIAYPSAVTIGRDLGISDRKVRDNLARLAEAGAIERARHDRRNVWILNRTPPSGSGIRTLPSGSAKTGPQRPVQDPDPTGTEPDASVREIRTPASTKDQGKNNLEDQDHRERVPEQFALIPQEVAVDTVRELWDLQERYRREVNPKARGLDLNADRRRRVASRLKLHGVEACRHVLEVRRAECLANPESVRWFNGVTNWRPEPFDLALSMSVEAAHKPKVRKLHHQHQDEDRPTWETNKMRTNGND